MFTLARRSSSVSTRRPASALNPAAFPRPPRQPDPQFSHRTLERSPPATSLQPPDIKALPSGKPASSRRILKRFPQATDKRDWRCVLKNRRRTRRIPYLGPLCIFWDNEHGQTKYLHAKFIDISERGLRIEVPEPLPGGSYVSIRADRIILSGSATVRYVERCGSKYFLGLELSELLKEQAESLFHQPEAVPPALTGHSH